MSALALQGQSGAGMMAAWGAPALIVRPYAPRMSDAARRVLVLRYWLERMEESPRSAYRDEQIFITEPKLRDAAAFVIGYGC